MFQLFDTMMDYLFTEQHWWPENLISMHEIHETPVTEQFLLHMAKVIHQGIFSRFVWLVTPHFLQENMISLKYVHFKRLTKDLESYFLSVSDNHRIQRLTYQKKKKKRKITVTNWEIYLEVSLGKP